MKDKQTKKEQQELKPKEDALNLFQNIIKASVKVNKKVSKKVKQN